MCGTSDTKCKLRPTGNTFSALGLYFSCLSFALGSVRIHIYGYIRAKGSKSVSNIMNVSFVLCQIRSEPIVVSALIATDFLSMNESQTND